MTDDVLLEVPQVGFHPYLLEAGRSALSERISAWRTLSLHVTVLRGSKMRLLQGLYDECAAALQFPLYFGENRDAFVDSLCDVRIESASRGVVVTVAEPEQLLVDELDDEFEWLLRGAFGRVSSQWARPVGDGEWWDRPAMPFHVVMAAPHAELGQLESRLGRIGISSRRLLKVPAGGAC